MCVRTRHTSPGHQEWFRRFKGNFRLKASPPFLEFGSLIAAPPRRRRCGWRELARSTLALARQQRQARQARPAGSPAAARGAATNKLLAQQGAVRADHVAVKQQSRRLLHHAPLRAQIFCADSLAPCISSGSAAVREFRRVAAPGQIGARGSQRRRRGSGSGGSGGSGGSSAPWPTSGSHLRAGRVRQIRAVAAAEAAERGAA